ncbi:unannotated protein [freshwater metagenome]|uniref:Unannotated protein n=1 Tax=freshwater metagenome TaxID=449393 RepID=A0A6J6UQS1_9ZZZZ
MSERCGLCTPNPLTNLLTYGESSQMEYSLLASPANSRICGCVAITWYPSLKASMQTFQLQGTSFTAWKVA